MLKPMKSLKVLTFLVYTAFFFSCAAKSENPPAAVNGPQAQQSPQSAAQSESVDELALGRKIYMSNCAACHKENGTGGPITIEGKTIKPHNLTSDHVKKFDDAKIYKYIYEGVEDEGMPAFKDKLSEADIREVVRFIRVEFHKMPEKAEIKPN